MISLGVWLARLQCTKCGLVSTDDALFKLKTECPNCGHSGESRGAFPKGSAIELLNLIEHFYGIADQRHNAVWDQVAVKLAECVGRPVSRALASEGWRRVNRVYSGSANHEIELMCVQQTFHCDADTAMKVLIAFMSEVHEAAEVPVVAIHTVTLVETILNRLLIDILVNVDNVQPSDAHSRITALPSFQSRYDLFRETTGRMLRNEVERIDPSYWSDWEYVRKKRNDFVHGNAYALGWLACERAYKVASRSVSVISALNNRFALKL